MNLIKNARISGFVAIMLLAGNAWSTPIDILVNPTSSTSDVDITINEAYCSALAPCSVVATLSSSLDSDDAMLGIGDSWTFDFFDVVVGGIGVVVDATVEATLGFTAPDIIAVASGQGGFFTFQGMFSGGVLVWDQPSAIDLGDGSALEISFENLLVAGTSNSTTVSATVSRHAVPEPGILALFGFGLLATGILRRRRGRASAG